MEPEIWVVSGSIPPINAEGIGPHKGIDGFEVYFIINNKKYKISNNDLNQYEYGTES